MTDIRLLQFAMIFQAIALIVVCLVLVRVVTTIKALEIAVGRLRRGERN